MKKFLILTFLATTALETNSWATVTCPVDSCMSCGTDCLAYLTDDVTNADGNKQLNIIGSGEMTTHPWTDLSNKSNITNVVIQGKTDISEGITNIPTLAFASTGVKSITIPDTVTNIGDSAFLNTKLLSIQIPDSVTSLGNTSFFAAQNLGTVVIGDSVTGIGEKSFYGSQGLTSVIIGDGVTSIGDEAFNSARFKSIVIGENVTSVGYNAFYLTSGTIFCPRPNCVPSSMIGQIVTYTKDENGVYKVGNTYYASAEDMSNIENNVLSPIACADYDSCVTAAAAYKDAKAAKMAQNGVLCKTKQGCMNLMNMVSNDTYDCTTIATCSAAVKAGTYNVNLSEGGTSGVSSGGLQGVHSGKRIYTVEEAKQAVEAAGTDTVRFRIRYK